MLSPRWFTAALDSMIVEQNLITNNFTIPSQAESEEEYRSLSKMGGQAQNSMIFTLIVPFCFMVFMSVSMNRVWSLYLML